MTFDEWWKDSEKSVYWCNNPDIRSLCKCIAQSAWKAAQPKWTYCNERLPTEADGNFEGTGIFNSSVFNVLHSNGTVSSLYYYIKLKAFGTSDGVKVYTYNDIIAWMPLPEAKNG